MLEPGELWEDPQAEELPEVQALAADGWRPLGEDPMVQMLPALWPSQHRCWVPDRLPRMMTSVCQQWGEPAPSKRATLQPWSERVTAGEAARLAELAAECGLPEPPPGRLWLLRSPWPTLGLEVVLSMLHRRCEQLGIHWDPSGNLRVAGELLSWTEAQVWDSWRGPQADAARAWEQLGRVGQDVAALVIAELGPADTARLTAPVGAGGAGLSEAQAVAWAEALRLADADCVVEAVIGWRALGLPAEPPQDEDDVLEYRTPAEAADWLTQGFSFEDMGVWLGVSLQSAQVWRDSGFPQVQARALLQADPTVTPSEAVTFDEVGIVADARPGWLEAGFTAEQARAWTEVDVFPQEARVWRSMGRGIDDARRHRAAGGGAVPDDIEVGWSGFGPGRADRGYGVTDPPGTRGRLASESSNGYGYDYR